MVERTGIRMSLIVLVALTCVFIGAAYAGYLLPQGIVPLTIASHELASVVGDDANRSVDRNLNGIIDHADSCNSCGGGGVGGAPTITIFSADVPLGSRIDAGSNAAITGAQFPLQLPAGTTYTTVRLEGGWTYVSVGRGPAETSTNSGQYLGIDWVNRKIRGTAAWHQRSSEIRVDNFQNGTAYCSSSCIGGTLVLDIPNRRIVSLPTEAFVYYGSPTVTVTGTVTSYS